MITIIKNQIMKKSYNIFSLFIDLFLSVFGIVITLPIIIITAILIKLEDKGPVFYSQIRSGKDGKEFNIYKLRSMKVNSGMIMWAKKDDDRITKVGRFIRRTRIDELPQFFNILKRDMSLIGPRPEIVELTYEFDKEIEGFINRLRVRPGITGWAQVNGGYDLSPREKLEYDMYYINNRSVKLDLLIIFKTFKVILNGKGAR